MLFFFSGICFLFFFVVFFFNFHAVIGMDSNVHNSVGSHFLFTITKSVLQAGIRLVWFVGFMAYQPL